MFDPVTISASLSVASAAFSNIKRMFQAGRDLEAMSQDLSRWMGAVSDVDNALKSAKNPSMLRKVCSGGSIEHEALEAYTAKQKLEAQRYELKQFLMFTYGSKSWDDLLAMEGQIRTRRQKEVYDKQVFREKVITYVVLAVGLAIGISVLGGFVYGLMGFDRGWW